VRVEQADLIADASPRRERQMAALDAVRDRFGLHMSQNAKTPSYTTEWEGLPTAR
jgi:DNA polymerase V